MLLRNWKNLYQRTRNNMINELRIVFSRSFKIIISYPIILRFSFSLFALDVIVMLGRKSELVCLVGVLTLGTSIVNLLLQIYYILYVYQIESVFEDQIDLWTETRKYFWKFISQSLLGLLISGLILLPFLYLIVMINRFDKSLSAILSLILFQFLMYISVGTILLSQQILLHHNFGILKNLRYGLKNLSYHQGYYFLYFIITSFITTSLFLIFGFMGSKLTNIDVFSVPIIPVFPFLTNYSRATSPIVIQLFTFFVYVFITPYLSIAMTLSYLTHRKYEPN
jgi:hypothetical protein